MTCSPSRRGATAILLSAALLAGSPGWGANPAPALPEADARELLANVQRLRPQTDRVALAIWNHAETGFQELQSSAALQDTLRAAGFTIEAGVAGMPTAFIARYRQGQGPVIGLLAEYDALPGLAQAAEPRLSPLAGREAGHACGHHLFGAAVVASAIAAKEWMQKHGVGGELRVYGSPAEEGGSGKVFLVREGLTRDVDAMLHWHPGSSNDATQYRTLANVSARFTFTGISAHAAMAPEQGRSALDGVEAMNFMVNALREHVPQETRIHYIISDGGLAPNVVPARAEAYYYVRHPSQRTLQDILARVVKAAEGAALGTGTQMSHQVDSGTFDLLPNNALGAVVQRNLRRAGGYRYSPAEQAFADALSPTLLGDGPRPGPESIQPPADDRLRPASTDVGDVSYTTPTAGFEAATWVPGTPAHSWQAVAAGGMSIGLQGANVAARTLALSIAELLRSPTVLEAARKELEERRGAGFRYRALIGDRPPPLDYRRR